MKHNKGFTLIELVVVVIILGILAITAAPRFISLSDDAANASLKAMKGTIDSALIISYAKMAIEGKEGSASAQPEFCSDCDLFAYGYPTNAYADLPRLVENMTQSIGGTGDADWLVTPSFGAGESWIYSKIHADRKCWLVYQPPTESNKKYSLEVVSCK
ncbi:type II secretion system protein [Shewanella sp. UCD-KL12]|uniref:type II secretion system protein n=1 Tax=Shewanella sp. UCD-KL12 TaxID=1917163 RepID=UPI0009713EE2|nr:type II secretion system protein [Shewanella sp. UCD-KL12]